MRLVTFTASGAERLGAFVDNDRRIVDLAAAGGGAEPIFASMQALIEGGASALDRTRAIVADARRSGRGHDIGFLLSQERRCERAGGEPRGFRTATV